MKCPELPNHPRFGMEDGEPMFAFCFNECGSPTFMSIEMLHSSDLESCVAIARVWWIDEFYRVMQFSRCADNEVGEAQDNASKFAEEWRLYGESRK